MKITPGEITLKNNKIITLRSPDPDEAQNLLDHLYITHSESYKNLDRTAESWKDFPLETEIEIIKGFVESKNKFFVTAFHDGKIIGGLGISGDGRPFRTHSATLGMSIQNAFKNQGLGSQMMSKAMEEAKKMGLHRIELTVRDYNESAIALYEKFSFEKVGTLKDTAKIDGGFVNEYLYQKIL
jgi:RimJ/RimL family protein N-acetyltransferase